MTITLSEFWTGFIAGGLAMFICLVLLSFRLKRKQ